MGLGFAALVRHGTYCQASPSMPAYRLAHLIVSAALRLARLASSVTSSKNSSKPEGSEEKRGALRLWAMGIGSVAAMVGTGTIAGFGRVEGGWVGDGRGVLERGVKTSAGKSSEMSKLSSGVE